MAQGYVDEGNPVKMVGEPLFYEPLSVAIDKSSELDPASLVEAADQIVADMHEDGTLTGFSEEWFDGARPHGPAVTGTGAEAGRASPSPPHGSRSGSRSRRCGCVLFGLVGVLFYLADYDTEWMRENFRLHPRGPASTRC